MARTYFLDKARAAFIKAGGDPDNSGPLAEWAERVRPGGDHRLRVIVAQDGTILGEARDSGGRVGASYITSTTSGDDADLINREAGLALGSFRRRHGAVISVTFSEVCTGAGTRG